MIILQAYKNSSAGIETITLPPFLSLLPDRSHSPYFFPPPPSPFPSLPRPCPPRINKALCYLCSVPVLKVGGGEGIRERGGGKGEGKEIGGRGGDRGEGRGRDRGKEGRVSKARLIPCNSAAPLLCREPWRIPADLPRLIHATLAVRGGV